MAIQVGDRVLIDETAANDDTDMHYRLKQRIVKTLECNLLVVTSMHIVLCQEFRLQLYSFEGEKLREWILEAVIRYIKVGFGKIQQIMCTDFFLFFLYLALYVFIH